MMNFQKVTTLQKVMILQNVTIIDVSIIDVSESDVSKIMTFQILYSFGNPIPKKRGWFAIRTKRTLSIAIRIVKKLPSSGAG